MKGKGERERRKGTGFFLWETITVDCAIYRLPLRSICKGKGQGGGKGERRKEKEKEKGEREREQDFFFGKP